MIRSDEKIKPSLTVLLLAVSTFSISFLKSIFGPGLVPEDLKELLLDNLSLSRLLRSFNEWHRFSLPRVAPRKSQIVKKRDLKYSYNRI